MQAAMHYGYSEWSSWDEHASETEMTEASIIP